MAAMGDNCTYKQGQKVAGDVNPQRKVPQGPKPAPRTNKGK